MGFCKDQTVIRTGGGDMRATGEHIIEVKDLVKKFGSFVANDHLTFHVEKG